MKVTGYIGCALILTCLLEVVSSESPQNKIQRQLLDAFKTDESLKIKRPFCNVFTGCGRKRSFYEGSTDYQDPEANDSVRLPVSVYKALLRAASQNIRKTIDRDAGEYQLSETPQVYFSHKQPLRKRPDILPTASD